MLPGDSLNYRFVARVPGAFLCHCGTAPVAMRIANGMYATAPILVPPRQTVRLYVVNAGPNRASSFHVVGGIFDHVYLDACNVPSLTGVQTVGVPVGGGAVFEVRLAEPGDYPFVSHAFAEATKGAMGVLRAK